MGSKSTLELIKRENEIFLNNLVFNFVRYPKYLRLYFCDFYFFWTIIVLSWIFIYSQISDREIYIFFVSS